MERKTGLKGLVLTLNDDNKKLTDEGAKKLCKRLLVALKDMAKRKGWSYIVWVFFSREEQEPDPLVEKWVAHKRTAKRPHFHVILYANPCSTVVDWMQKYWNAPKRSRRKRLGIVRTHDISNFSGYVGYCNRQKSFKERRQEHTGEIKLEMGKISSYEKGGESQ